jgi:hypothetical protein
MIDPGVRYVVGSRNVFGDVVSAPIVPIETGWLTLDWAAELVGPGEAFDVWLTMIGQGTSSSTDTAYYNMRRPDSQPVSNPLFGRWYQPAKAPAINTAAAHENDDNDPNFQGADRSALWDSLNAGDKWKYTSSVDGEEYEWTFATKPERKTNPSPDIDQDPNYYEFHVMPGQLGPDQGKRDITFTLYETVPLSYVYIPDGLAAQVDIKGIYSETDFQDFSVNDNYYGIDIEYRPVYLSPDWQLVAYSAT